MSTSVSQKSLFAYTAGRWLHLDKAQRDARYVEFDFDRLCEKVLSLCPSATSVESFYKLEGGFSKVLVLNTNNGKRIVVKFPTSVVGPARYVTNSEVATMTYLQHNTKIPIPAILDWSDDPANPIGSAYIIMEHVDGVLLQEAWADMPSDQKIKCVGAICSSVLAMSELDFPAFGSLYLSNASFLDIDSKKILDNDARYYAFGVPNRGPWHDLSSYSLALIDSGLARLPPADHPIPCQQPPPYQGTVDRHLELLKLGRAVIPELAWHPDIKSNSAPTLFHPDLHKRNIFISKDDPTKITGTIDWQCTSVEPAFYYADDSPDFAKAPPEGTSEFADESLCSQAYEIGCTLLAPRLGGARKIDETLLRPFRYCHRTWRDGFVPFTHELLQLRDSWQKLGFEKNCPIPALGPDEMSFYKEQLYTYNSMLELRQDMVETLGVEGNGWTSEARWEGVRQTYQYFYDNIMANLEDDKQREEVISMWPFDQPVALQQPRQI
ncbi:hypothetical protein LOZ65_002669 [Ophidiomyces ophidiicola]|nr:hypothetical protein LOZ65_002669 [Ophidiomyces ophidiicola]